MRARPTTWAFCGIICALGLALGYLLAVRGYAVPVTVATLIVAGAVQLSEARREAFRLLVRDSLDDAKIGFRQAARIMEQDPKDLQRALNEPGYRLDAWRLEMLPDEFHRAFAVRRLGQLGLPALFNRFLRILPAIDLSATRGA